MLYADYIRRKMRKLSKTVITVSGYPLKILSKHRRKAAGYTIYGRTATGNNLLPYPYLSKSGTYGGVIVTVNGDGSITADGTAESEAYFNFYSQALFDLSDVDSVSKCIFDINKTYCVSQGTDFQQIEIQIRDENNKIINGNADDKAIFNLKETAKKSGTSKLRFMIFLTLKPGVVYDGVTFYPMINEGHTALEYEQYTVKGGIGDKTDEDKYKIQIINEGKNVLPYPYINTTKTANGITFTDNGDGSVTVNGTAEANASFYFSNTLENHLDKNAVYALLSNTANGSFYDIMTFSKDGAYVTETGDYAGIRIINLSDYDYTKLTLYRFVRSGQTIDSAVVRPMLVRVDNLLNLGMINRTAGELAYRSVNDYTVSINGEKNGVSEAVIKTDLSVKLKGNTSYVTAYSYTGTKPDINCYFILKDKSGERIHISLIKNNTSYTFTPETDTEVYSACVGIYENNVTFENFKLSVYLIESPGYEPYREREEITEYITEQIKTGGKLTARAVLPLCKGENRITLKTDVQPVMTNIKYYD